MFNTVKLLFCFLYSFVYFFTDSYFLACELCIIYFRLHVERVIPAVQNWVSSSLQRNGEGGSKTWCVPVCLFIIQILFSVTVRNNTDKSLRCTAYIIKTDAGEPWSNQQSGIFLFCNPKCRAPPTGQTKIKHLMRMPVAQLLRFMIVMTTVILLNVKPQLCQQVYLLKDVSGIVSALNKHNQL